MNEEEKYFNYSLEPGKIIEEKANYDGGKPLISIITAYYNCKEYIEQTANSVFNQTFPFWEWIIVNDGSTEAGTEELLNELERKDERIKVYHKRNEGRLIARDYAISKTTSDIIYMLDSDDLIDKTLLECGYWTLYTNPEAKWAYSNCVNFEGMEFLYKPEFNSEQQKKENLIIGSSFIRKAALLEVGGYNAVDKDVHEDWHLWLRMLEKNYFPVKMNYYGFWYRKRKGSVLDSFKKNKKREKHARKVIKEQAKKINEYIQAIQYPVSSGSGFYTYPTIFEWNREAIYKKGEKKRLLFILPWFVFGGADKFNYDLISRLNQDKYDITIVTTEPCDYIWRQKFEKFAEIFDLTTFLHRKEWAAFLHYIIKSREIDLVMLSNSYYGYYIVPWLKSEFPDVIFTDYIHAHDWSWRNGGYPRESIAISNFLDKTYTCNNYVKNVMFYDMDRKNKNVETVYVGVDTEEFDEKKVEYTGEIDFEKLKNKKIILFICRIVELKRPIFMLRVFKEVLNREKDAVLLVVGDGEQLAEMKLKAKELNIKDNTIFTGMQSNVKPFYKVAAVTVICSLTEGLAVTSYESLAMSTPVVTSDVGGQSELVDDTCGKVIPLMQSVEKDLFNRKYKQEEIESYVNAILEIINSKDYEKIKENCRKKIEDKFSTEIMVRRLDNSFTKLIEKGTQIDRNILKNQELFEQYLVLYNEIDKRNYNPEEGGVTDRNTNYRTANLKSRLWSNPLYRITVKGLKKAGIWERLKEKYKSRREKDV